MYSRWNILLYTTVCILCTVECSSDKFELTAPTEYVLFSKSIAVTYTVPHNSNITDGLVQMVRSDNTTVIHTVRVPMDKGAPLTITVNCGALDQPGKFKFRLMESARKPALVESELMEATWPKFHLALPNTHIAFTKDVQLQVQQPDQLNCESLHNRKFWLEVTYFPLNATTTSGVGHVAYVFQLPGLGTLQTMILSCSLFDQAGKYKVFLKSNHAGNLTLAASNLMEVSWSSSYNLRIDATSIFPCTHYVAVSYKHPSCIGTGDKIRMYKQVRLASASASPTEMKYIMEQRVEKRWDRITFRCSLFHENMPGYCFTYVSTSKSGAVTEQDTLCVPATKDAMVDGAWGSWSEWNACPVTCGHDQQNRYRSCDRPAPMNGGAFCKGDTSEWRECGAFCKELTTEIPPNPFTLPPQCPCGCDLSGPRGKIVVASSQCRGSSVWLIEVSKGYVIKFWFELFTLDPNNPLTRLKIRDGSTQMDDLLIDTKGGVTPRTVVTKHRSMLIEFMAPHERTNAFDGNKEGFIAYYDRMVDNTTAKGALDEGEQSVWERTVTLVGIGLCVVIVIAAIIFVCQHRQRRRHKQEKQQQAQQSLLINGELPNSPSHSGNSIGSGGVVPYVDSVPTSPTRRDYVMARGVSTHPQRGSQDSGQLSHGKDPMSPVHGARELRRGDGAASKQSSHSSLSHQRSPVEAYAPNLPSPYALNANDNDYVHDGNLFSASPLPSGEEKSSHRHGRHHRNRKSGSGSPKRHRRRSPNSPGHRSTSPTSPTKHHSRRHREPSSPSRRRRSKEDGPPLADEEDLSPMSPTSPIGSSPSTSPHKAARSGLAGSGSQMDTITENIPLDSYYDKKHKRRKHRGDVHSPDHTPGHPRPPVEGRDSLERKKRQQPVPGPDRGKVTSKHRPKSSSSREGTPTGGTVPTTPDYQNANVIPANMTTAPGQRTRPVIKPLPLRDIQRPDGQSPEHPTEDNALRTPSSNHTLSPVLQKTTLFPDLSSQTPSEAPTENDGFEYDDYVPDLPGSYFTMDPHAYTLTWSQHPPWSGVGPKPAASHGSITDRGDSKA